MFCDKFIKNLEQFNLSRKNDKILLAVSGGIDSMTMAYLFIKNKYNVGIAHCNFLLRGEDSNNDEDFVHDFAKQHNIEFFHIKFDTKKYASEHKISIEMAARDLRYNWFETLRTQHGYSKIAIAHNLNDTIETFFLNIIRGTGIKGMTGISAQTKNIIRPLMFASRAQIEEYAKLNGIAHRNDATNDTNDYTRNKIRHIIVPEFEKINPSFLQTMQQNINHAAQSYDIIEQLRSKVFSDICVQNNNNIFIDIKKLQQTANARFWLFEILSNYGFNSTTVENISVALNGESGRRFFSPTHILIKDREKLIIEKIENSINDYFEIAENSDNINFPIRLRFEKIKNIDIKIDKKPNIAYLNYSKLEFPLILRKWRAGDSFTPFGMHGRKKLSDFFIDLKFSIFDKENQYVITSGDKIVWVVNCRIDDNYKVDKNCETIFKITTET